MKKCTAYFLILAIPLIISLNINFAFSAEEASSIMWDNGVVNIGDMNVTVQDTCGEPNSQTENEWVYNFGPFQPVYTLIFKEGQLEAISKIGFWVKIAAGLCFKPEEYSRISRI